MAGLRGRTETHQHARILGPRQVVHGCEARVLDETKEKSDDGGVVMEQNEGRQWGGAATKQWI